VKRSRGAKGGGASQARAAASVPVQGTGARLPEAVIFDFDGVIADTENVHIAAWERAFAVMGWTVSPEACARAAEIDDREFLAEVFAARQVAQGDLDGWVRRKQEFMRAMLGFAPRVCPGAAVLVRRLEGRARLAVVSSTWRENIETVLRSAAIEQPFEVVIAKEDVERCKHDPTGYHLALGRLAVAHEQAVALEDSLTGMQAARAAGLRCVLVGKSTAAPDWAGQAPYLPDLVDAEEAIRVLSSR
jgi:beta-phosphoglucomutase